MTAARVIWHPRLVEGISRITERQRAANIAAEGQPVNVYTDPRVADEVARYENYMTAKTVLQSPDWYDADVVRAARDFIHEYEREIPKDAHATVRRKFVAHYDPDRVRPRDLGLGTVFAVLLLAAGVGLLTGLAAQMGWL
jgi:hypothetical protein